MKLGMILSGSLMLTSGLIGCGSGDSGPSIEEYNLSSYKGRSVSSESLAGTWVSTYSRRSNVSYDGQASASHVAGKVYFVIRNKSLSLDQFEASTCYGSFTDIATSGAEVNLGFLSAGMTGSVSGNTEISASHDLSGDFEFEDDELLESVEAYATYQLLKISDSTEAIGSYSLRVNDQQIQKDAFCFEQYRGVFEVGGRSFGPSEDFLIGEENSGYLDFGRIRGGVSEEQAYYSDRNTPPVQFSSEDGDSIHFSINEATDLTHQITLTASSSLDSLSGSIQVQLPAQ